MMLMLTTQARAMSMDALNNIPPTFGPPSDAGFKVHVAAAAGYVRQRGLKPTGLRIQPRLYGSRKVLSIDPPTNYADPGYTVHLVNTAWVMWHLGPITGIMSGMQMHGAGWVERAMLTMTIGVRVTVLTVPGHTFITVGDLTNAAVVAAPRVTEVVLVEVIVCVATFSFSRLLHGG